MILCMQFTNDYLSIEVPESGPPVISPSRSSSITRMRSTTLRGATTMKEQFSTYPHQTTTFSDESEVSDTYITENSAKPNVGERLTLQTTLIPLLTITVLTVVVCTVVCIFMLRRRRKSTFDLTTNEAYVERKMYELDHIDDGENTRECTEALQHVMPDTSDVALKQNSAYCATTVMTFPNVASSESHEYDYINCQ